MFGLNLFRHRDASDSSHKPARSTPLIESLEGRQLLSASAIHHAVKHAVHHATAKHASLKHHAAKTTSASTATAAASATATSGTTTTSTGSTDAGPGLIEDTIIFSQAPAAIQKGLVTLAAKDSLAVPTSTQTVYLGNFNGIESYTLDYTSSGTSTRITVDQNGNAVTEPTESTTTWATLSGSGTGNDPAAAGEISAIATALGLTAPIATTTVYVSTPSSGPAIYSVHLSSSTSTAATADDHGFDHGTISVDANGIPSGNQALPFSVIPTAIQNGFNNNLPTGASVLATTSTQNVNVRTIDGVTLFSTTFTTTGTSTTVTVNSTGVLTSLPTETTSTYADLPVAVQTELQTLATADGFSGTLSSTQSVRVYTEANGAVIYTISVAGVDSSSNAVTVTISVDQNGNPTVAPGHGGGGCGGGGDRFDNGLGASLAGGWGGSDFGAVDFGLASFGGGNF